MADTKMSEKLWRDCKSDQERADFILCGRAHETGVIAKSIQSEVAMAFQRLATLQATPPADAAKVETQENALLATTEARYRDLLNRLGVNGHDGAIAEIDLLRRNIDAADGEVPKGFVMVPAKPTSDQLIAGAKAMFRSHGTQNGVVGEMYAAMLAASQREGVKS